MAGSDGAHYTAEDLAKEIRSVLERLQRRVDDSDVRELSQRARRLEERRHGSARELSEKAGHVQRHVVEVNEQREKAYEALKEYAGPRFPSALSAAPSGSMSNVYEFLKRGGPAGAVREEHEDKNRQILREIKNAGRSAKSFRDRVREWWEKFQAWLNKKLEGLATAIGGGDQPLRDWLIAHEKQIGAIFTFFALFKGTFGKLVVPLLLILGTGSAAFPIWIGVQVGMAAAQCAWKIIKGDEDHKVDRFLLKKQLFAFARDTTDIFAKDLFADNLGVKLGLAVAKTAVGIVLGPGEGESTRKHIKRRIIDGMIDSTGLMAEFFGERFPSSEQAWKVGKAAATYAMQLVRGPDVGKNRIWHGVKQTFRSAVETLGIFDKQILKEYHLPEELGGLLTMWAGKSLAKDLYSYAEPRAKKAEAARQIRNASPSGAREKWRTAQGGAVRSWLLDRGEKIEGGLLRIGTIKRFYGPEITKIVIGVNDLTNGIALPVWTGVQLGLVSANYGWRVLRGNRTGQMTPQHRLRQRFWAGIEAFGIFADITVATSDDPKVAESSWYQTYRYVDGARFMNQFLGHARRYRFDGRTGPWH